MKNEFKIVKSSEDKQIVFGWANIARRADGTIVQDCQDDIIDINDLETAAYDYVLDFRDTGERHDPQYRKKGKLIESIVFTQDKFEAMGIASGLLPEGWWVGYKIADANTWEKIKSGEYLSFSIEGTGDREEVDKNVPDILKIGERNGTINNVFKAKTFSEVYKRVYHRDRLGRFASDGFSGGSTTPDGISAGGANDFEVKAFASKQKLNNHFAEHGKQYKGYSKEQYVKRATELLQKPTGKGILGHMDKYSVITRYDVSTNDFAKGHPKKGIYTMFKPKDGLSYYERMKKGDIDRGGTE